MYKGELATHSEEYRCGHSTGLNRGYYSAMVTFEDIKRYHPKKRLTIDEILFILEADRVKHNEFCETYGMGIEKDDIT